MTKTLKTLRESRKYNLKQLADRVGCSAQTLSIYETNPPARVNQKIIVGLAQVLDVTPDYILKLMGSITAGPSEPAIVKSATTKKTKPAAEVKRHSEETSPKRKTRIAPVLTTKQATTLVTLIQAEIKRLREFILEAEQSLAEEGKLKTVVQDTYSDIQTLTELSHILTKS